MVRQVHAVVVCGTGGVGGRVNGVQFEQLNSTWCFKVWTGCRGDNGEHWGIWGSCNVCVGLWVGGVRGATCPVQVQEQLRQCTARGAFSTLFLGEHSALRKLLL